MIKKIYGHGNVHDDMPPSLQFEGYTRLLIDK